MISFAEIILDNFLYRYIHLPPSIKKRRVIMSRSNRVVHIEIPTYQQEKSINFLKAFLGDRSKNLVIMIGG
jgi:hypothetical protein